MEQMVPWSARRIAITGMAVNTPLGDRLGAFEQALFAGRSAITRWRSFPTDGRASQIGGDLGGFDASRALAVREEALNPATRDAARRVVARSPWSVGLSVVLAVDAWQDAGLGSPAGASLDAGVVVGGYQLLSAHQARQHTQFDDGRGFVDPAYAWQGLESTHASAITDVLGLHGGAMQVSAACASALYALRAAIDEIRCHGREAVLVAAPVQDFSALDLEALAAAGALAQDSFNDEPERASRPFDRRREGMVPAHGGAAIVIEPLDRARARGANVYGEVVAAGISTDATSLPVPSREGQARAMRAALRQSGLQPADIDYVCGHFTSTLAGDRTEAEAIGDVFGSHAEVLRVNATKSLIGHTMGASGLVELVGAVLQMRAGRLHGSLNVDEQDPAIRLDVCAEGTVPARIRAFMKNAFGFGGLNASVIVAAPQP